MKSAEGRTRIFRDDHDYAAFEGLLARVHKRLPTRILSYCLMSNHWHLVLWPKEDRELSDFVRLLGAAHTQCWQDMHPTGRRGPLCPGRFKSYPIQPNQYLLDACRHVERNAPEAKLVERAEDWQWSSAVKRGRNRPAWLLADSAWPVPRPSNWLKLLNTEPSVEEWTRIQLSETRSRPLGDEKWVRRTAKVQELESTVRPQGRPRNVESD